MKKNVYSASFKSKLVLECLKELKTTNQISVENKISPSVLSKWRSHAIKAFPELFVNKNQDISDIKKDYENQIEELYKEIGKLTTELSWLKKKYETIL